MWVPLLCKEVEREKVAADERPVRIDELNDAALAVKEAVLIDVV